MNVNAHGVANGGIWPRPPPAQIHIQVSLGHAYQSINLSSRIEGLLRQASQASTDLILDSREGARAQSMPDRVLRRMAQGTSYWKLYIHLP